MWAMRHQRDLRIRAGFVVKIAGKKGKKKLFLCLAEEAADDFHAPGQAEVEQETSVDATGAVGEDAEEGASEKAADAFCGGFAEVDGAIEDGCGQDDVLFACFGKCEDEEAPEKQFDAEEVDAVGGFEN